MKTKILFIVILSLVTVMLIVSCSKSKETIKPKEKPWNITIFLDLSDRLIKGDAVAQKDRDIADLKAVVSCIKDDYINILKQRNHNIQVVFHPQSGIAEIDAISRNLSHDFTLKTRKDVKDCQKYLISMDTLWSNELNKMYDCVLTSKQWEGSDIWGFFNNQVQHYIRPDYRNIVIILTDGYIYHINNKIQTSPTEANFVVPLNIDNISKLTPAATNLKDLEVLVLEVDAYDPKKQTKLESLLQEWFKSMGCKSVEVLPQNLPPTVKEQNIKDFLNK